MIKMIITKVYESLNIKETQEFNYEGNAKEVLGVFFMENQQAKELTLSSTCLEYIEKVVFENEDTGEILTYEKPMFDLFKYEWNLGNVFEWASN